MPDSDRGEKWPRQYAHDYIVAKMAGDRDGARQALACVPEHLQALVKAHIQITAQRMEIIAARHEGEESHNTGDDDEDVY